MRALLTVLFVHRLRKGISHTLPTMVFYSALLLFFFVCFATMFSKNLESFSGIRGTLQRKMKKLEGSPVFKWSIVVQTISFGHRPNH